MKNIFLLILFFAFAFKHPFYLSVTDLKYNAKERALQGSVKIFTNDLEDALRKLENKPIDLINPKDTAAINKILFSYLQKHLSFKINGKPLSYTMLGFEHEQEAIWIYIESAKCPLPKKVEIENSLLYDFISSQSNIVHLEVNGKRKSLKADCPEKVLRFEF